MELKQLHAFLDVADCLRSSGPCIPLARGSLSLVESLEAEMAVALFVREAGQPVELTLAGGRFALDARRLLERVASASAKARAVAAGMGGQVRVGICEEITTQRLSGLVRRLRQDLPDIEFELLELSSPAIAGGVRQDRIDLGFVAAPINVQGLVVEPLGREGWTAVLPPGHRLTGRAMISIADLVDEPLILADSEQMPGSHGEIRAAFEQAGLRPQIAAQVLRRSTMLVLANAGIGVTFVPASFTAQLNGRAVQGPRVADCDLTISGIYRADNAPGLAMRVLRIARGLFDKADGP